MTRCTRSSSAAVPASSSSTKKFDVFEFNEEDERVEEASASILCKFGNPKKTGNSPIDKYKFLEVFTRGPKTLYKDISSNPIDLDCEVAHEFSQEVNCSLEDVRSNPLEVDDSGIVQQGAYASLCSADISSQNNAAKEEEVDGFLKSNSDFGDESVDTVSNDDENCQISSSSTSTISPTEVEEDQLVENGSTSFEINDIKMVVTVFPDFIRYGSLYSTMSRLIFSCSSLKLEGSTVSGTGEAFKLEWVIDDIIKIESCWFGKVETAMINLLLKSKDLEEPGSTNQNSDHKELKFAVYDPYWSKAEEAIKLLDVRYLDIWNAIFDIDTENNENVSAFRQNSFNSRMHYFPIFDETFDEVIYPKGEPDAVSISRRDVELLQPETFINDTIIDFYIKYLKNKIPPDEQQRFHFFNSFFFRKLADLDKDPLSACDGRAAFQRVRKWTRKVNLFEKDYVFIPINYSLHWSLIVICHPGEVACFRDEAIEESSRIPCILHMDSLKGSHKGLKNVLQSYLSEEWNEKHSTMVEDVSSKFLHLRFVSLELPQQENLYDCGLFLLHYVELFLKEAPIKFNPYRITKFSDFLTSNWFPPTEASLKRVYIQKLIFNLLKDNSEQTYPADYIDKGPPSEVPGFVEHEVKPESPGGRCHPTILHGNLSSSTAEQETDIQFPVASPIRLASCFREPELVLKDIRGAVINMSFANCQQTAACHQRGFTSPIEEIREADEETAVSSIVTENTQAVLGSDFPSTSYFSKDLEVSKETLQQGCSVNLVEAVEGRTYSKMHSSESWNELEIAIHEDQFLKKNDVSNSPDQTDRLTYTSTSDEELADCVVEDSQEANVQYDVDVIVNIPSALQSNVSSVTRQISNLAECINLDDDTIISEKEPLPSESDERDAKRPKLMHAGGERRLTRSQSKKRCFVSL